MIVDRVSVVPRIFDCSACIGELEVFEVKIWLISFEKNYLFFVLIYKGTFSAHSLDFSQKDTIKLPLAFYLFFLKVELYSQWLRPSSICNFNRKDQLPVLTYISLSIEG